MLNIKTLVLGVYETNCYLLWSDDSTECIVIDPGYEAEQVLEYGMEYMKALFLGFIPFALRSLTSSAISDFILAEISFPISSFAICIPPMSQP